MGATTSRCEEIKFWKCRECGCIHPDNTLLTCVLCRTTDLAEAYSEELGASREREEDLAALIDAIEEVLPGAVEAGNAQRRRREDRA